MRQLPLLPLLHFLVAPLPLPVLLLAALLQPPMLSSFPAGLCSSHAIGWDKTEQLAHSPQVSSTCRIEE
jgi:hypothetical protein